VTIESGWLTGEVSVPEDFVNLVAPLQAFLESNESELEATKLIELVSSEDLLVLVSVLAAADDATRISHIKAANPPKAVRKMCGKLIHRLKAQGITVSAKAPRIASVGYLREELSSYMATPLAMGLRMIILSGRCEGALTSCYAVVHESEGVDQLMVVQDPSSSRLKKIMREVESQPNGGIPISFVECPHELARQRIQESIEIHRAKGHSMPSDYARIKPLIDGLGLEGDHPVLLSLGELDAGLISRGSELLGRQTENDYHHGVADRLVLPTSNQREFQQRLMNAIESPVVLNDAQRRERVVLELEHIVRDVFHVERRVLSASRLLDTAMVLAQTGSRDFALVAAATARALLDEQIDILNIPWARESIFGLVDIDQVVQGIMADNSLGGMGEPHGHVHGPGCNHDHQHTDSGLIIPG